MPLEDLTGTDKYIDDLVKTNPDGALDKKKTLDDHTRGIKNVLLNTFKYVAGVILRTEDELNNMVPVGLICMWNGVTATIPTGWQLCDGTNGTPDLRERMIWGSIGSNPGQQGGSTAFTTDAAGAHNHQGSTDAHTLALDEVPSHVHPLMDGQGGDATGTILGSSGVSPNLSGQDSANAFITQGQASQIMVSAGGGGSHNHGIQSQGSHTHVVGSVLPPYYALCYIQRMAYDHAS